MAAAPLVRSRVGGAWVDGGEVRERESPARPGLVVARLAVADRDVASAACDAAAAAAPAWRRTPAPDRAAGLERAAALLVQRTPEIGRDLALEEGKTLPEATGEVARSAQILRYFAAQAAFEPDGATFPSADPATLLYARREPIGVVAAVTPWNFPIAIPAWKIAPALAYGNAVVWKPAELVPLTSHALMRALLDAGLPDGALQLVVGSGSVVGPVLCEHPAVDGVTFTGSDAVGQTVLAGAAPRRKRVQLELGGKNPAVVLAGADLALAARTIARGAFLSGGQKCTATSRVIVESSVADAFTDRLVAAADLLQVGDPLDPDADVGPLVSPAAADGVREYLALGEREGRRLTARGSDLGGAFVAPTVLAGLPPDSAVVREEIFGPVAALQIAEDADHALALANDTPYGLSASVFTRSAAEALRFSRELDVGAVKVNQESPGNEPHLPFGGTKASSYGSGEQGKAAAEFFTHWKSVYLDGGA